MALRISSSLQDALYSIQEESKVAAALGSEFTANEIGDYVSFAGGLLTYLPKGTAVTGTNIAFTDPRRLSGRPARMARKFIREDIVELELLDSDFELFANKLKSTDISETLEFTLVTGSDIKKYYSHNSYTQRGGGTLASSCMRYDECQKYMGIYADNPTKVAMLVSTHKTSKLLYGRALVWYTDEGDVAMDRVYGTDAVAEMFRTYGLAQGWYVRAHNNYQNENSFIPPSGGKAQHKSWGISIDKSSFNRYPYMDTFKYLDTKKGWLTNDSTKYYTHQLTDTSGHARAV